MKSRKMDALTKVHVFLFILIFALRGFTDAIFVSKGVTSNFWINLKYYILLIAIVLLIIQVQKNAAKVFLKELYIIIFVVTTLVIISLVECLGSGNMYSSLLDNAIKMLMPIVYVFLLLNILKFEDIYFCMAASLIVSLLAYIVEIGTNNFSIVNIMSMKFSDSYSPFESHYSAGISIALCSFFMYYRKNKVFQVLSFIYAIFTFKRLFVLFAIFLWTIPKIIDMNKKINKKSKYLWAIIFIGLTFLYCWLLLPQSSNLFYKLFGETQNKFTMGRYELLRRLESGDYRSAGLGSTTDFLGKGLEMDLIRILKETTCIGLITFCFGYFMCAGNRRYTLIFMIFQFFNLLTSHSIYGAINWILILLTIGCISYKEKNDFEKFKILDKKQGSYEETIET